MHARTLCLILALAFQASSPTSAAALNLPQRWVYCPVNLLVDQNVERFEQLMRRAASAGYTGILLSDSKFTRLGDLDARYFRNIERVKKIAADLTLEIVPAVFSIGYSNDLLWHDPNLIEALPVHDALFVVNKGEARLEPDPSVALRGGGFSDLNSWDWRDPNVVADQGAARITDPRGQNARIAQKIKVRPFRQYHVSLRIKTQDFGGTPEVKVIGDGQSLDFDNLGVKRTQDWSVHDVVFNSLTHDAVALYLGCWGGETGSLWYADAKIEEVGLLNLVRREGAPLSVKRDDGASFIEGRDFERIVDPRMGTIPWPGNYDVWHQPPVIKTSLADGTRLRVSYFHAVTIHDNQAMICPSEPKTIELLRDQARRRHAACHAKGYMMSHDEIRVLNWDESCPRRHLDAGAILADNVKTCIHILREVNPDGDIYVWSDMLDPNHNAHNNYYRVRGDLTGSWNGLDRDVTILPWCFDKRDASLKWFADRGHQQLIAGDYDHNPEQIRDCLTSARNVNGVIGVMYTTWENQYTDLEKFEEIVDEMRRHCTLDLKSFVRVNVNASTLGAVVARAWAERRFVTGLGSCPAHQADSQSALRSCVIRPNAPTTAVDVVGTGAARLD